jgi:hypothetical protein
MTDISRSLQNNSTAQKNTHIDADYLDRQEQGKNIDLKQKVGMRSFGKMILLCMQCVEISYNCLGWSILQQLFHAYGSDDAVSS